MKDLNQINGIILLNKERGISSNKVVNKVKYLLKANKAGHLGTLDVLGEGLLPVTLGKATKIFDFFLNKDKIYKTIFRFGETTDTLDLEGIVTQRNDKIVTIDDINKILFKFVGKQDQIPPLYSAKKINGRTAYSLAREGVDVKLKPKEIEVYSINCIKQITINTYEFEIHCSSGTYIRSICRDLAIELGTYGVMLSIIRTKCGDFSLDDAYTIKDIETGNYSIIMPDEVFKNYKSIFLNNNEEQRLLNGLNIKFNGQDGIYRGYAGEAFLGLLEIKDNLLKIKLRLI